MADSKSTSDKIAAVLAGMILSGVTHAAALETNDVEVLEEIIVTAQKT